MTEQSNNDILLRIWEAANGKQLTFHFEIYGGVGHGQVLTKDLNEDVLERKLTRLNELYQQCPTPDDQEERAKQRKECLREISSLVMPKANLLDVANSDGALLERFVLRVTGKNAAKVPWEAMEAECYACDVCWLHYLARSKCQNCGRPNAHVARTLSEAASVVHLPNVVGRKNRAGGRFIFLEDPALDVYEKAKPDEKTALIEHHKKMRDILEHQLNYAVEENDLSKGMDPMSVLSLLQSEDVAGIYYFGHAGSDGEGPYLQLKGGNLYAKQLRGYAPFAPFVFLNACYAAAGSESLADAFASLHSVVIAPLTQVSALESAQLAEEFFERLAASAESERTVAQAWRQLTARDPAQWSSEPAQPEQAHRAVVHSLLGIYRILGPKTAELPPAPPKPSIKLFARDGSLQTKGLSEELRQIFCAARRVDSKIKVSQITRRLERSGNLTRHIFDGLVLSAAEERLGPQPDTRILSEELDSPLYMCLEAAAKEAAKAGRSTVSEGYLLKTLVPYWHDLQDPDFSRELLDARLDHAFEPPATHIDRDGHIDLSALTATARRLVHQVYARHNAITGLTLFEQFVLAASLENGCAGAKFPQRYLPDAGIIVEKKRIPANADRGVLIPMLQAASARRPKQEIDVHQLFSLFCRTASRETREAVQHDWQVDLDDLGCICRGARLEGELDEDVQSKMSQWDPSAWDVIHRFHALVRELHSSSNRLLFAAFLDQAPAHTAQQLKRMTPVDRKALSNHLIDSSFGEPPASGEDHKRWQEPIKKLIVGPQEPVSSTILLARFGEQLPERFRAGLRKAAPSWRELNLSWIKE